MPDVTYEEWRPKWSPEEEAEVAAGVIELKKRISMITALRKRLGLSQQEMADILETTQSNVSKIEARGDPRVSVIKKMIEAKGGRLKVVAEFPDAAVEIPIYLPI